MTKLKAHEKRLQALKRQLYGKEQPVSGFTKKDSQTKVAADANPTAVSSRFSSILDNMTSNLRNEDVAFLRMDLFKILVLSALAIGIQISLYVLSTRNLINLNLRF